MRARTRTTGTTTARRPCNSHSALRCRRAARRSRCRARTSSSSSRMSSGMIRWLKSPVVQSWRLPPASFPRLRSADAPSAPALPRSSKLTELGCAFSASKASRGTESGLRIWRGPVTIRPTARPLPAHCLPAAAPAARRPAIRSAPGELSGRVLGGPATRPRRESAARSGRNDGGPSARRPRSGEAARSIDGSTDSSLPDPIGPPVRAMLRPLEQGRSQRGSCSRPARNRCARVNQPCPGQSVPATRMAP